jgi:hypothetical protein
MGIDHSTAQMTTMSIVDKVRKAAGYDAAPLQMARCVSGRGRVVTYWVAVTSSAGTRFSCSSAARQYQQKSVSRYDCRQRVFV